MADTIVIPGWSQGRTGMGQGGWSSAAFEGAIGQPVSISLKAPIPLDTPLDVTETGEGWRLANGDDVIMTAAPVTFTYASTEPVSVDDAADARSRFPCANEADHPAPGCYSCGLQAESMQVHPGPLADGTGRFATDWTPPASVCGPDGIVDTNTVWASLDCISGFYVGHHPIRREALTVQYSVEIVEPLRAGEKYVIVAWDGRWTDGWDGRKRGAASAVFDADGSLMARSDSFWVALA